MGACIAIVSDMIFANLITASAEKIGANCKIINDPSDLQYALESSKPGIVLVEMHCDGISPEAAIRTVKSHRPNARVVAFFSHVQTELMERARAAGADDAWPRSAFVQRLPQLLEDVQAGNERV